MAVQELPLVIIPAHNEAAVISRLLTLLEPGVVDGQFRVIVACNGCTDNTPELVKQRHPLVQCLDIERSSKTAALNAAEAMANGYPRVFIDADVVISHESVIAVIEQLRQMDGPALVAPVASINTNASDFLVKIFYRAWKKTRFFSEAGFGSGVYAINRSARAKFSSFPSIISDDGFIREVLDPDQISRCKEAESIVQAPRTYSDLIKIRTRSKLGNLQLRKMGYCRSYLKQGKRRFTQTPSVPELVVYLMTNLIANGMATIRLSSIDSYHWQRDESSRGQPGETEAKM